MIELTTDDRSRLQRYPIESMSPIQGVGLGYDRSRLQRYPIESMSPTQGVALTHELKAGGLSSC